MSYFLKVFFFTYSMEPILMLNTRDDFVDLYEVLYFYPTVSNILTRNPRVGKGILNGNRNSDFNLEDEKNRSEVMVEKLVFSMGCETILLISGKNVDKMASAVNSLNTNTTHTFTEAAFRT